MPFTPINTTGNKMTPTLDDLLWHDGNLISLALGLDKQGNATVTLEIDLYPDEQTRSRQPWLIECQKVSRFHCTLDLVALKQNLGAGHIANGYLKDKTLWLYFSDGLLEISAKQFRLAELTSINSALIQDS